MTMDETTTTPTPVVNPEDNPNPPEKQKRPYHKRKEYESPEEDRIPPFDPNRVMGSGKKSGLDMGGGGWGKTIIAVLLAVIISLGIASVQNVSKKDFTTNIQGIVETVNAVQVSVQASNDALTTAINNIPNQISSQVSTETQVISSQVSQLSSTLSDIGSQLNSDETTLANLSGQLSSLSSTDSTMQADITSLDALIDSLQTQIDSNKATITSLQTTITSLQTAVTALQTAQTSGGDTSNQVTAEIVTVGDLPIAFTNWDGNTQSITFRLKITNGLSVDIENVQLVMEAYGYPVVPTMATNYPQIASAGQVWTLISTSSNVFYYSNAYTTFSSLAVDAGDMNTYYVTLSVKAGTIPLAPVVNVNFSVDVSVDSYDEAS